MCGRYTLSRPDDIAEHYEFSEVHIPPRFNAAPTDTLPIVRSDSSGKELVRGDWGFRTSPGRLLINARSETVHRRPAFSESFHQRRCLVPADGFFEWEDQSSGKQPYLFQLQNGKLFSFAGLWEAGDSTSERRVRFTILTCEPNSLVASLHDRMPVILPPDAYDVWLGESDPSHLLRLLQPFPADKMQSFPVSRAVNRVKNDSPDLIRPVESGRHPTLFDNQ